MQLLIGLGNPGPKYSLNRHNIGFLVIDALAQELSSKPFSIQGSSHVSKVQVPGSDKKALLVKPQTYMNLSGEAVQALMAFYKINKDDILVIHDDIDQPFSQYRLQKNRGHGGQNGVRNIHDHIGSDYARLKMGVGRPTVPQMDVSDHVLQNFSDEEQRDLPDFIASACEAVLEFAKVGFVSAQNKYNQKPVNKS